LSIGCNGLAEYKVLLALFKGEKSGISKRSVTDIARNAKRRLKRA
jgi:hypothetical protein